MYSRILDRDIPEESPSPGYFFYGEEVYLADEFVRELRGMLVPADAQDFQIETFYLDETKWADIIDTARTVPFLFASWRLLVVKAPEKKPNAERNREKEAKLISATEEKILKSYFASPAPRTVIVILLPGKIRKGSAFVKFVSALAGMVSKEIKPLREAQTKAWMEAKARSLGKTLSPGARSRLFEIVGSNLRLMDNEVEKLAVFVDERKTIETSDVDQATAWLRDYEDYELDNGLAKGDFQECLIVLNTMFKTGERPERILSRLFGFFRNILLARTWLEEKSRERREIFKTFHPQISESFRQLYQEKYAAFFSLVDGFSKNDLRGILNGLADVDLRIKSTDIPVQTAFEAFLFDYCRLRKKPGFTSKAWG